MWQLSRKKEADDYGMPQVGENQSGCRRHRETKDYRTVIADIHHYLEGQCVYCHHCLPCPQDIQIGWLIWLVDHAQDGVTDDPMGWYINLQQSLHRTVIGFDFMDQDLDIVVKPDLSAWVWKDEATFARAQELGIFSDQQTCEIRAEGERVIECVRTKASPFNGGWENRSPDPEWPTPSLSKGCLILGKL